MLSRKITILQNSNELTMYKNINLKKYIVIFYYTKVELPFTYESYINTDSSYLLNFSYDLDVLVKAMKNNEDPDHPDVKLNDCKVMNSWIETFKYLKEALEQLNKNPSEEIYVAFTDPCLNVGLLGNNRSGEFGGWIMKIQQL